MIEVLNLKNGQDQPGIRCDRCTVYGNPFHMRKEADRDAVCDAHRHYLWAVYKNDMAPANAAAMMAQEFNVMLSINWEPPSRFDLMCALHALVEEYERAGKLSLLCWCAPKRCHCDTLAKFVVWKISTNV